MNNAHQTFFMLNSTEHKISQLLIKHNTVNHKYCLTIKFWNFVFMLLKDVKMPTIVCIFTFMSGINSMLGWVEHEKKLDAS